MMKIVIFMGVYPLLTILDILQSFGRNITARLGGGTEAPIITK
jgi:hypothetical protein